MKLYELAHSRAGDKGDTANISVIAYQLDDYELLKALVTTEKVAAHFGDLVKGSIIRYELPQLGALNFVLNQALSGGVTRSLALDPHGKCLSGVMLDMDIADIPDTQNDRNYAIF